MDHNIDIPRLLVLRKLTTEIASFFQKQLEQHLINLTPLLDPKSLLGGHIRAAGTTSVSVSGADKVYQEIRRLYQPIATAKPFSLPADLTSPLDIFGTTSAIATAEYIYTAQGDNGSKEIRVTTPLNWVLTYKSLGPKRLRDLVAGQAGGSTVDVVVCVLHYLVMHMIASKKSGIAPILGALRYPVESKSSMEFGGLPFVNISCPISTVRPSDEIIMQSTEISGMNAFEEVVNLDDIKQMQDPIREQVLAMVKNQNGELYSEIT